MDECVDRRVVAPLAERGHEVAYVFDLIPGASDYDVLALANETQSILVTEDKDFGDMVFDRRRPAPGIILIRMTGARLATKQNLVASLVEIHEPELSGNLSVVTLNGVRMRRIEP